MNADEYGEEMKSFCLQCGQEIFDIENRKSRRCSPCMEGPTPRWIASINRERLTLFVARKAQRGESLQ